ncbi:MAG: M14 metallopeptidase family protein [Bacteroidota bacterium]
MRKILLLLALISTSVFGQNSANNYKDFFPAGTSFDPAIPTPEQFLGYPVGDWHTRHDRIVEYFKELARLSPKAHFQIIGYTHEQRPQVVLTITSTDNYNKLDDIRKEHLKLSQPGQQVNTAGMPVVITHGYNVHGNEPSSSEAAMLTAYYLVASQGDEISNTLRNAIIHIDPNYNPDGRDRHTMWANMNKSFPPVADPADREHNEAWPGGRTNHYWFDLNRDWLPLAHPESRNRVAFFHQWLPNVCTDYHEMGTNATNFFEPTKPLGSENPVVPRANYEQLNNIFARYFSKALDEIGSLYFTKEEFDNSYPGYGSTYPDIHGGLGLVFEQASSRGHVQQSSTKVVTFAFTIRNHVRTSLATIKAAVDNRELLLKHQQEFFKSALDEAKKSSIKGYAYGDAKDKSKTKAFTELLLLHKIEIYKSGDRFLVPTDQTQYRLVRSFFEKVTQYHDSVFYDASTWTMALAYNMPYEALSSSPPKKDKVTLDELIIPLTFKKSTYAYLMEWSEYNAPKALWYLLDHGVFVKSAFKPFAATIDNTKKNFGYGTLVIPVADQNLSADDLHKVLSDAVLLSGVDAYPVNTGFSLEGVDLGSNNIRTISKPKVAMLVGDGVAANEAGFVWYLSDSKIGMPITKVNTNQFANLKLQDYTTIIMVSGNYTPLGDAGITKLKTWMQQGGSLILVRNAVSWAITAKLIEEQLKKEEEKKETPRIDFGEARDYQGSRAIGGSIYMTDLDITHPLGFGYTSRELPVWRNHNNFLEPSKNPFSTIAKMTANPRLSGYIHPVNLTKMKNSPSLMVSSVGQGRAILFIDDPNFRGYWYGTNKMFINAIFLGSQISAPAFDESEEK